MKLLSKSSVQHISVRECIAFSVILLVFGFTYWQLKDVYPERFHVDASCDLKYSPCDAISGKGRSIRLSISPDGIPLLEPLNVSVALEGITASSVEVVFSGVDVDMGRLAYPLSSHHSQFFSGGASLSVCTRRSMTWEALVVITEQGRRLVVPFRFDTEYRSKFELI